MSKEVRLIAFLVGKPERRSELLARLVDIAGQTAQGPGVVQYDFHVSADDPNRFVYFEIWESEAALSARSATSYMQEWDAVSARLLACDVLIERLQLIAGHRKG